jgi:MFS family permease
MGGSAPIPPTEPLFVIAAACAAAAVVFTLVMKPARTASASKNEGDVVPISQILRIPGLVAVVTAGVIMVAASDTVVVYIGLLLTVRAAASMVARLFYARMVAAFGRWPLMIAGTFVCGLSYAAIAAPIPLWAMHIAIAAMGFSFGLATTLSITIVVDMTTVSARGTTNSLRIMSNRIGQFVMPFGAGLVAAAAGLGGLFLLLAAAIAAAAGSMVWKRPGR